MRDRERETALLALLDGVTAALSAGDDLESAARATLRAIRKATGWPLGHIWVPEGGGDRFVSSGAWTGAVREFPLLYQATAATRLPAGTDIVGRAAATGEPVWSRDVTRDPLFTRARHGADIGVRAAFALPVATADGVAAVLEFFCHEPVEPDESLLRVLASLSRQMGRVIDRHRARQEAEAARRRLEQVVETSVEAFVSVDTDDRIVGWNATAERMFGIPRDQAIGTVLHETIMPVRYREDYQADLARFLTTGKSRLMGRRLELAALRSDGSEFPAEMVFWATREADTWIFNAFVHDITDRRRVEQALREAYAQQQAVVARLQELDRAKDEFIDTVGHELRTPLVSVLGYLEILTLGNDDLPPGRRLRMLDAMTHNALRLQRLVEDLLAVTTTAGGRLSVDSAPTPVDEIIAEAVQAMSAQARSSDHPVLVRVDAGLPLVRADRGLLVRALNALLSNAAKFSPAGSPITVSASATGDTVSIAVSDAGAGIDAEDLPHVFDRFYRARSSTEAAIQGIGLGLTVAKAIAEAHHGTITATSVPGEGSTFTLTLRVPDPGEVPAVRDLGDRREAPPP
ncbi:PAS domain S-box protein [Planomonospora sp. ID91781]|uniref:sensor histidine kinase n=1 Tax=Planomonospora sp. ID91781 TaxID=2738135 RepID=UPI0018C3AF0C|nr:ATP-binding protein [Planomonospora sp. ID91781]MBG0824677.1 PAS domain S-box protein [Planomonospora sp. ID91781]